MGAERFDRYLLSHELGGSELLSKEETAMKTITSALVALLVIAGAVGTAQAFDVKSFYDQVDRHHN